MNTVKKAITTAFGLTLLATSVAAADYEISVCKLQSHSSSSQAYLKPCETWSSKNQCNAEWVTWDISKFEGQLMYSTALAAMLSGKTVTLRLDGTSCNSYDVTTMIRINN